MLNAILFVPLYARWHYSRGIRDYFANWFGLLWFISEYFSIVILFKTLFAPWQRMIEEHGDGFSPSEWAQAAIVNTIMRVVGLILRSVVLLVGILSLFVSIILGALLFVMWVLFPVIMVFLLSLSIKYIFG